jgi:hypothetical protein
MATALFKATSSAKAVVATCVDTVPAAAVGAIGTPVSVGDVRVLLVSVSVVARPTNVSVAAGSVIVPDAAAADLKIVVPDVVPAMDKPFLTLNSFAISFHFPRNGDCLSSPQIKQH